MAEQDDRKRSVTFQEAVPLLFDPEYMQYQALLGQTPPYRDQIHPELTTAYTRLREQIQAEDTVDISNGFP